MNNRVIGRLLDAALDALAALSPVECAGCGGADRSLCASCRRELVPAVTPRTLPDGLTVFTALRYEGVVRQVLLALKENGRTDVARALGASMAHALARASEPGVEFVAVPTSRRAWRRRGYDPVALIMRRSGYDLAKVLFHGRATESQKTLDAAGRAENLHESMTTRRSLEGRRFLLVDDILTTGATFAEAARALRAAGGEVVGGAALAFTPRLFGRSAVHYEIPVTLPARGDTVGRKARD